MPFSCYWSNRFLPCKMATTTTMFTMYVLWLVWHGKFHMRSLRNTIHILYPMNAWRIHGYILTWFYSGAPIIICYRPFFLWFLVSWGSRNAWAFVESVLSLGHFCLFISKDDAKAQINWISIISNKLNGPLIFLEGMVLRTINEKIIIWKETRKRNRLFYVLPEVLIDFIVTDLVNINETRDYKGYLGGSPTNVCHEFARWD